MSTMTISLPQPLHDQLKELARIEGISINQFLVVAAAERMSVVNTLHYLESEAKLASRNGLERVMKKCSRSENQRG